MKSAQTNLELLLSLRRDGVAKVADEIQTALGGTAGAGTAVDAIAGQMQAFNASDVIYSQRVAPLILKGLKDDGIAASYDGTAGEQVLPYANFLPDNGHQLDEPRLRRRSSSAPSTSSGRPSGTPAPGLHGHQLDSVSVGGVDLTTDGSNRIPASPPPTFVVNFTNGGENDETNVKVTVEITGSGTPIRAQTIVPEHDRRRVGDRERDAESVALDERRLDDQSDDRARSSARRRSTTTRRRTPRCSKGDRGAGRGGARRRRAGAVSSPAVDELTSTTGIVALAAGALALVALADGDLAGGGAAPRAARPARRAGRCSGASDLVAHAAGLEREFRVLHEYVEDAAARLHERMAAAEAAARRGGRLPRARALRRLRRDVGPPVDLDRAARRAPQRRRAVLDPPPRAGAAVREAGRGGVGELELSPEEQEAVRLALAGAPPLPPRASAEDRA